MRRGGFLGALALLLLPLASVGAQEADAPPATRVVMLYVDAAAGAGLDAVTSFFLPRSALAALQAAAPVRGAGLSLRDARAPFPTDDAGRTAAAAAEGASGWVHLAVTPGPDTVRVRVEGMDLVSGASTAAREVTLAGSLDLLSLPDLDWGPAAAVVARDFPAPGESAVTLETAPSALGSATLTVKARPGTTLQVRGTAAVIVGPDGAGMLTLPAPAEYRLRASAPDMEPVTREVFLSFDREISLDQAPATRWAVDLSLLSLTFPAARVSWYPVRDAVFLQLGVTTYAAGLAFTDTQVLSSVPLTNIQAAAGLFLLPSDSAVRPYLAAGGFLRLVHASVYTGLEPVSPGGLSLTIGAEIAGSPGGAWFAEYEPMMYFTASPSLFLASLGASSLPRGWLLTQSTAMDLMEVRLGYRWRP